MKNLFQGKIEANRPPSYINDSFDKFFDFQASKINFEFSNKNFIPKSKFFKTLVSTQKILVKEGSPNNSLCFKESPIYLYYFYRKERNETKKGENKNETFKCKLTQYNFPLKTGVFTENFDFDIENDSNSRKGTDLNNLSQRKESNQNLLLLEEKSRNVLFPSKEQFLVDIFRNGSRSIQSLSEILGTQFGNHLHQNLNSILEKENILDLIQFASDYFTELLSFPLGSNFLKSLLEKANLEDELGILIYKTFEKKIKGRVIELSSNKNASHLIHKFIIIIRAPYNNFIFEEIYSNFMELALSKYGCCVIKKCFLYGNQEQKEKMLNLLLKNDSTLITHEYGFHIFESIIVSNDKEMILKIYKHLSRNILLLCKNQYSSIVIEKFFDIHNKEVANCITKNILSIDSNICELTCHEFGNYIIQKILKVICDKTLINKLLRVIYENFTRISKISYGKKLLKKLTQKYSLHMFL